jgi:hypothetical protein
VLEEARREPDHARRDDEHAVALVHQRARRHAFHHRLLDPHHAVILSRQRAERAPEAKRQRAGDHAEGLRTRPARLAGLPARRGLPEHPAPEAVPRQPAPGEAAAHRRAEEEHRRRAQLAVPAERIEDQRPAEAVPREMRRPRAEARLHECRQRLDARRERVAAVVDEDMGRIAGFFEPGTEEHHGDARHPKPRHQHHVAPHSPFPALAKIALARAMRRPAATR